MRYIACFCFVTTPPDDALRENCPNEKDWLSLPNQKEAVRCLLLVH